MTKKVALKTIVSMAISLAIFACSDSNDDSDNNPNISSSSLDSNPNDSSSSSDGSSNENSLVLNFTSDYTTGELRWMNANSTSLISDAIDLAQDTKLSVGGGKIFALNRTSGAVTCISPENMTEDNDFDLGDVQNPYEVAVIGNKGYIVSYDADYLQVFDIKTCTLTSETINLGITDAYAASVKASGDTLLVVAQRLDVYTATKPGLLIRIKGNTVLDTIQLKTWNPASNGGNDVVVSNGKLIIAANNYGAGNDGIEIVDLTAKTSEVIYSATGAVNLALDKENQILYAAGANIDYTTSAKSINLATNEATTLPDNINADGGLVFDEAGKKLFIGDRSMEAPGLKIYTPATGKTTTVNNGDPALPPYSLAIISW